MRTALAIRHVHFEDLGTLEPLLTKLGYRVEYLDAAIEPISASRLLTPDLLVVLGGPIGVYETVAYPFLVAELESIAARVRAGRPTIGICLGAQLIARALGADVTPMGGKEIGFGPLDLSDEGQRSPLAALGEVHVLHWHGDTFELPDGAVSLARTHMTAAQAFAIGEHTLGLQFHPEVDSAMIEHWLVGHASELAVAGIDPTAIRTDALTHGDALRRAATTLFLRWLSSSGASV